MTVDRSAEYLISLVNELRKSPKETEWIEFKFNNAKPDEIGEKISALANSAALCGKAYAYLVWGIHNDTHEIIGTDFSPHSTKINNEELENWLLKLLKPKIHFRFFEIKINDLHVVLLEIPRAFRHPVQFKGDELIRIGSYTKKLKDFPEKERTLWRTFDATPFESHIAAENIHSDDVLKLLDYPSYFERLNQPLPENRDRILDALKADALIANSELNKWNILNLGAILFAKKLSDFKSLMRKSIRVVLYKDNSRSETIKEHEGTTGYASGFEKLSEYINNLLPSNEVIEQAFRKTVSMYPIVAIRELVANAIIHQDFFITGTGPMIEIFKDRIEITNPGQPLIETTRFLDNPPRSRNEALASFMRRVGLCEERGSGVDRVVLQTELHQLPAPIFEIAGENTRVILFAHQPMKKMTKNDRIRACYLHACLKCVERDYMTNSTLRERFVSI
jgi:ATP-dependent DNA helicase RecG